MSKFNFPVGSIIRAREDCELHFHIIEYDGYTYPSELIPKGFLIKIRHIFNKKLHIYAAESIPSSGEGKRYYYRIKIKSSQFELVND
jgi:hypothetical protein